MLKNSFFLIFTFFLSISLSAQVPDHELDVNQYPANNKAETKREAAFAAFFEEANVSNLHVYAPQSAEVPYDYYYLGRELPRGFFGLFNPEWRSDLPKDFKVYAVSAIRGDSKPYYIMRFAGQGMDPTIALFEINGEQLDRLATLASFWCTDGYCYQRDSWIQDVDGDARLDIITKVRMTDKRRSKEVIEEHHTIFKQLQDGTLVPTSRLDVDINDYFMHPHPDKRQAVPDRR